MTQLHPMEIHVLRRDVTLRLRPDMEGTHGSFILDCVSLGSNRPIKP
jgi:hypothetical protein